MANKKTNKYVPIKKATKKPQLKSVKKVKPAPAPKKVEVVKNPRVQAAQKKQKTVRTKKVSINSIPQQIVTKKTNTYDIFGYKIKKSYVWIGVAVIVLLCVLF